MRRPAPTMRILFLLSSRSSGLASLSAINRVTGSMMKYQASHEAQTRARLRQSYLRHAHLERANRGRVKTKPLDGAKFGVDRMSAIRRALVVRFRSEVPDHPK